MPQFSYRSKIILSGCHPKLIRVFEKVVEDFDCTIVTGHRKKEQQNEIHRIGLTQLLYPHSLHNLMPSKAVDAYPYPIDWKDRERMTYFAGYVLGIARRTDISLIWGGDWNGDWQVRDNVFDDLGHFELRE